MIRYSQRWLLPFLGVLLWAMLNASVRAEKHPAEERGVKSLRSDVATQFRITNGAGGTIKVYWLNYEGKRELKATLRYGESMDQITYLTHPWLVTTDGDKPLGLYFPDAQPRVVRITATGDQQSAELASRPADSWADALNHYAGRFNATSEMKNRDQKETIKLKGPASGEWIHDGAFLRQIWSIEASGQIPAMSGSSIMTFDPQKKIYRRWSFMPGGGFEESRGQWDSKTRTMTWTAAENQMGGETVTRSAFDNDGRETWSVQIKDGEGKVGSTISGTSTPQKRKE